MRDLNARAIATSIVELARAVGVTVVAEGVEPLEQAELLRGAGLHDRPGLAVVRRDLARGGASRAGRSCSPSAPVPPPTSPPAEVRPGAAGTVG